MELFKALNVEKKFSNHLALDNVSITVSEGSIFGLLGPNGAGKTTLIRIITQITAPDKGELIFKGRNLKADDIFQMGYLPEERGLYKKMKVGEQALYLAQLKGLSKKEAMKRLKYWFEKFEIQGWWNKKVEELSKGMQQKIQFIITILHEPELLIFDEPFSGFDPINSSLMKQELLNLQKKGSTIIFSTHNMESVEELCNDISLINNSKVILDGNVNELRKAFKSDTYEVTFTGDSEKLNSIFQGNDYQIVHHQKDYDAETIRIKVNKPYVDNELLSIILPQVHIISFSEVLPGMNDIFIRAVNQSNTSAN